MKIFATTWAPGETFILTQSVNYNGTAYICIEEHTAGATFDDTKFTFLDPITDAYYDPIRDSFTRQNFFAVDLVYLGIPDSTGAVTTNSVLRLATGGIDIEAPDSGGTLQTWSAQGDFMGFSSVTEEFDVKVGKFTIYLSGLSAGMVDKFLGRDFEGKQVVIAKAFLNYDDLSLINDPVVVFEGIIYNIAITETASTCSLSVECSTLWADFERTAGRMTNNNSNWRFQYGDTSDVCFEKAGTVGNVEYKWGRA